MANLIDINNLHKAYGPHVIFAGAGLTIAEGQKIGVIGRNGAGKTTLFRMLTGDETPDKGSITIHNITRLGYLQQHETWDPNESIIEYLSRRSGREEWTCAKLAHKFLLTRDLLQNPLHTLSGGMMMRARLTAIILAEPNLLLFDEPTNYLDLRTLLLLEKFLKNYNGAHVIISHDREFLKNTCEQTVEVDQTRMFFFPQPLEEYLAHKAETQSMITKHNKKIEREAAHLQSFVDRFRYKASKATQAQSKLKQIARLKKIEIVHPLSTARIQLPPIENRAGLALRANKLAVGYEEKIVANDIELDIERGERIAILGDNGEGKSTLLKTIAGVLPPIAGNFRWMPHISIGYYAQESPARLNPTEQVGPYLTRLAGPEMKREQVLAMAGNFLFRDDDLKKPISILSGGERARLCLAGLLLQKDPVLILDEPTNHLDFETVEALGMALASSSQTILFVSHNRTFVNLVAKSILEVKKGQVTRYPHNYEEYVYHLSQQVVGDEPPTNEEKNPEPIKSSTERKTEEKRLRRAIKNAEELIGDLEAERKKLLKEFERAPTAYAPERAKRLQEIEMEIAKIEDGWLENLSELEKNS